MKVEPNDELKQLFLDKLKEKNSKQRPNIGVSDLVYCLREAYFRRIIPKPPTPKQLGFYTDGSRRHVAMEALSGLISEVEVERYGVVGHVDMLKDAGVPIEFKSTRARKNLSESYFLQLAFYSLMLNVKHGYLIVQRLMSEEPWEFYHVEWTPEEMLNLDYELHSRSSLLRESLEKNDPSTLPKPDVSMEWKCRSCIFKDDPCLTFP